MNNQPTSFITIPVDYGYAFDYLAILEVKINKSNSYQNIRNFTEVNHHIKEQIGESLFFQVLESEEYRKLVDANLYVFDLVDAAKTDSVSAAVVDKANYQRFLYKRELQSKFFPDAGKFEQKIGY